MKKAVDCYNLSPVLPKRSLAFLLISNTATPFQMQQQKSSFAAFVMHSSELGCKDNFFIMVTNVGLVDERKRS